MFGFDDKKKKIFTIGSIIYAVLILLVVVITNFDRFSSFYEWMNDKLAVLSPIVIGGIMAYLCNALVKFFQNRVYGKIKKKRTKRSLSIISAYALIIAALILFVVLIIPQLLSSIQELVKKMGDGTYLNSVINAINGFLNRVLSFRGGEEAFEYINMESIVETISNLFAGTENILNQLIDWVTTYGGKIFTGLKNGFIGFLLSIYFVIYKERLYAQSTRILAAVFSKKRAESILDWFRFSDKTFGGFIVGKLIDATFIIVVCSIVFSIASIPYSILVSVVIGICNIIPFFGPFIGAIPCGFIVFIARPDKLFLFIILLLVVQQIDANIIEPKIVGDRTGLTSLGVLVAVTVMSGYFGILGMFLGVPIFAVVCAILKKQIVRRLEEKNLPVPLSAYYSENSLATPHTEVEHLSAKLFRLSGNWLKKKEKSVAKKVKRIFKNKKATDATKEAETTSTDLGSIDAANEEKKDTDIAVEENKAISTEEFDTSEKNTDKQE